jgi:hypothetical protein
MSVLSVSYLDGTHGFPQFPKESLDRRKDILYWEVVPMFTLC